MDEAAWRTFRENCPEGSEGICTLATTLYEMGTEKARGSKELEQLTALIRDLPEDAQRLLGFGEVPSDTDPRVLVFVIDLGSKKLLQYVRG
jgi:hypothetical protein